HSATVRHGVERRETKSLAAHGQRGISKNSRSPKLFFQDCDIKDWPAKNDPFARDSRALSQSAQISVTSSALPGIRRTNNYEFPIGKLGAAQPRECFYQNVHAFFPVHSPGIE